MIVNLVQFIQINVHELIDKSCMCVYLCIQFRETDFFHVGLLVGKVNFSILTQLVQKMDDLVVFIM